MARARSVPLTVLATALFLLSSIPREATAQTVRFRRGDANADGKRDISDPVYALMYLFSNGSEPPCKEAADSNDDGQLDISDPIYSLGFLFVGSAPPPGPFPGCGEDSTPEGLGCASFPPCTDFPVYMNIQVDAEQEDVQGLNRIVAILKERGISATIYVSADYANRNALLVTDLYTQGFEIAMHGYYTGEQLASMTYDEQKDLLTRAKKAIEGCKPCGSYKPVVGFRPQYFSQNEDTFRVLDELGLTHNSGFKLCQLFTPGHEWDAAPYAVEGRGFSAVPITTIPYAQDRIYICDISCLSVLKLTGAQWRDVLLTGLNQSLQNRDPLVILLHGWCTGDTTKYDYWQPFVDLLDAAQGKVTFVSTKEFVDAFVK